MRYVICYDIADNRSRTKVRKLLLRVANPINESVFEADLTAKRLGEIAKAIRELCATATDNVRVYSLCERCAGQGRTIVGLAPTPAPIAHVV